MKIRCVWEHNGEDTLLYADNFPGAFTRGASKKMALDKMGQEVESYLRWSRTVEQARKDSTGNDKTAEAENTANSANQPDSFQTEIIQEKSSGLDIRNADSDVLFDKEKEPLTMEEYQYLKGLVLKSAQDFLSLYEALPDKDQSALPERKCFYGEVPRTGREMYEHTKCVNSYYFGEIEVPSDREGTILECRVRGFELLEQQPDSLANKVFLGSYDEEWSLRKVLRRFLWHDRIHAKAMYRMAKQTFGEESVPDVFRFEK